MRRFVLTGSACRRAGLRDQDGRQLLGNLKTQRQFDEQIKHESILRGGNLGNVAWLSTLQSRGHHGITVRNFAIRAVILRRERRGRNSRVPTRSAEARASTGAARQLVYTEAGRGVESVIVDGRVVMKDRIVKTIDEDALRREVAGLMRHFIADYDAMLETRKAALPHMLEAHRRTWQQDVGMNRFIERAR